jgi:hypothetical protein
MAIGLSEENDTLNPWASAPPFAMVPRGRSFPSGGYRPSSLSGLIGAPDYDGVLIEVLAEALVDVGVDLGGRRDAERLWPSRRLRRLDVISLSAFCP